MMHRGRIVWIISVLAIALIGGAGMGRVSSGIPVLHTIAVGTDPRAIVTSDMVGHAFVYSNSGVISMLDTRSGAIMRTLTIESYLGLQALTLDERAGLVFVAGRTTGVQALDTRTGKRLRTLPSPLGPYALAVDNRNARLLLADLMGRVVRVFEPSSGRLLRTVRLAGRPTAIAVDPRSRRVFVALDAGLFDIIDERNGHLLGAARIRPGATSIVVDSATNHVFVVSQSAVANTVTMLDARTGARLSVVGVGRGSVSIAIDARTHRAFVSSFMGSSVSVLDTRSGVVLRVVGVARAPVAMVDDERDGRVFVTCFDPAIGWFGPRHDTRFDLVVDLVAAHLHNAPPSGNVVDVLDARTGLVTRTVRVGGTPLALGVDTASSRMLVADTTSNTINVLDTHAIR